MIKIDLYGDIDFEKVDLEGIKKEPIPAFASFKPDFGEIWAMAKKYKEDKNLIIIGNGGSITSFWAFYKGLAEYSSHVCVSDS